MLFRTTDREKHASRERRVNTGSSVFEMLLTQIEMMFLPFSHSAEWSREREVFQRNLNEERCVAGSYLLPCSSS